MQKHTADAAFLPRTVIWEQSGELYGPYQSTDLSGASLFHLSKLLMLSLLGTLPVISSLRPSSVVSALLPPVSPPGPFWRQLPWVHRESGGTLLIITIIRPRSLPSAPSPASVHLLKCLLPPTYGSFSKSLKPLRFTPAPHDLTPYFAENPKWPFPAASVPL